MTSTVFKSENQPEWGNGLVVEEGTDYWVLVFENGGRKKFIKSKTKGFVPVTLDAKAMAALEASAKGKHTRASTKPKVKKPGAKKKPVARFENFQQQLAFFQKLFEGGFEGAKFTADERGPLEVTGKATSKAAAITTAQAELSAARFASATPEELFASAVKVLKLTNIVFPIEGAIPFAGMAEGDRPATLTALKQLLHGEGEYGDRLTRFASAVQLKDKKGVAKTVTWPFATVFGALFNPTSFTCVKPTPYAGQAALLGIPLEKSQPVTAAGYALFHEVALKTRAQLVEAGEKPRDLMDVYSFIYRTHAEKPADMM